MCSAVTSACSARRAVASSSRKVAVWAAWNQYFGYALAVERHDGQRRRFRYRVGQRQLHAILGQLRGEELAERVGGEVTQEAAGLAQPGDGPGRS